MHAARPVSVREPTTSVWSGNATFCRSPDPSHISYAARSVSVMSREGNCDIRNGTTRNPANPAHWCFNSRVHALCQCSEPCWIPAETEFRSYSAAFFAISKIQFRCLEQFLKLSPFKHAGMRVQCRILQMLDLIQRTRGRSDLTGLLAIRVACRG